LHLRNAIAIVAAGLACSAGLWAAATQNPQKKTSAATKTKAPARRTQRKSPARAAHSTRVPHAAKKAPVRASWRGGQTEPTPERYKQFQEALIAKGYLHGEATGKWDEASADAMRRFQRDQNLEPTGKPNESLSIIALGLGPKY
jgi:peptidoglycan hydrolase-like protein with peptidoglycan-binding domain